MRAKADRFRTKTIDPVVVPGGGSVNVPIQLDCTQVRVIVQDNAQLPIPGALVWLMDTSSPRQPLLDLTGQPFSGSTGLDGSVVFSCVPHGPAVAQTDADPNLMPQFDVPADGMTVTITVQNTCGNLIGKVVTGPGSQTGVPNATVSVMGTTLQTTTNGNGNFRFDCLTPAGRYYVIASKQGCSHNTATANVPTSGDSQQVVIPLSCSVAVVDGILVVLHWAAQPPDLDLHLSGPNGHGGRFHLFYGNRSQPPVPYANLDTDDVTSFGPETVTISKAGGAFVAGDYHVWVHNYIGSTFAGSNAVITVLQVGAQGILTQLTRQIVQLAMGDPADDLWHVVNLDVGANGSVTVTAVQTLQPGNSATIL